MRKKKEGCVEGGVLVIMALMGMNTNDGANRYN